MLHNIKEVINWFFRWGEHASFVSDLAKFFGVQKIVMSFLGAIFAALANWSDTTSPFWKVMSGLAGFAITLVIINAVCGLINKWRLSQYKMRAASTARTIPDIEIRFKPRAPYEAAEIITGHVLSIVRIGLKAGQSFSSCRVFIEKIAPEPMIYGGLPMLLQGSDFILRHDDPEKFLDIASHWEHHGNKFRFHNIPGVFSEFI